MMHRAWSIIEEVLYCFPMSFPGNVANRKTDKQTDKQTDKGENITFPIQQRYNCYQLLINWQESSYIEVHGNL